MKRTILLVCAVVVAAWAGAQEVAPQQSQAVIEVVKKSAKPQYRWTIDLNAGLALYQQLFMGDFIDRPDVVPGGTISRRNYNLPYAFGADIYYRFTDSFSLGLRTTLSYEQTKCFDSKGAELGSIKALPATAVLVGKWSYYKGSEFEFYGLYGLGVSVDIVVKDFYWKPSPTVAFNDAIAEIYPIGLRWGHKRGCLIEFGMGSKGLFNVGYFRNF